MEERGEAENNDQGNLISDAKKRKADGELREDESENPNPEADNHLSSPSEGDGVSKKKSSIKTGASKFFDDEAEDEDSGAGSEQHASGGEEEDDENEYKVDDFLVPDNVDDDGDAFEESDSDGSGEEEGENKDNDNDISKSVGLSRLKKRKSQFLVDEEDLELIEENKKALKEANALAEEDEDDTDVIAPVKVSKNRFTGDDDEGDDLFADDEGASDEDEDLVEGEDLGEGSARATYKPSRSTSQKANQRKLMSNNIALDRERDIFDNDGGPTKDQLADARDIFGDGFEFDDLEDEYLEYDEDADEFEDEAVDSEDRVKRVADKARKNEERLLTSLRAQFDRDQLISNFCTNLDDEIRRIDRPERFQSVLLNRSIPVEEERVTEAAWMAKILAEKIISEGSTPDVKDLDSFSLSRELSMPIQNFLKFVQVDNLEVPFIWTYRKDYLHKIITRQNLWFLYSLDEKWENLYESKSRIFLTLDSLSEAAQSDAADIEAKLFIQGTKLRDCLDNIQTLETELRELSIEVKEARALLAENNNGTAENDEEATKLQDRERLEFSEERHVAVGQDLARARDALRIERVRASELKVLKQRKPKYRPEIANEILRLFPKEQYLPLIENASEEVEMKDITTFLETLIRGCNQVLSPQDEDLLNEIDVVSKTKTRIIGTGNDKYKKFCQVSRIREFLEQVSVRTCEFGDAFRHGFKVEPPPTPSERADQLAIDFTDGKILVDEESVLNAASFILATELSVEPSIRREARRLFQSRASVSTRPTTKGLTVITPFNELFGLHYIERKPLSDFYSNKDKTLFVRLEEAQSQGLIEVTINPPEYKTAADGKYAVDIDFFLTTLKLPVQYLPSISPVDDMYPHARPSYDTLRLNTLQMCIKNFLIPFFITESKRELLRLGREAVIEEACVNFSKILSVGPYCPPEADPIEATKKLLTSCPRRPYYGSVMSIYLTVGDRQPVFMAFVDKNGVLRSHDLIPERILSSKKQILTNFMLECQPDLIVINSSGGFASRSTLNLIEKELIREVSMQLSRNEKNQSRNDEYDGEYSAHVCMVKDDVASIFKNSTRATKMFPNLQPGTAAAICLARFVQEPLAEYCNMWWSADGTANFGQEILFLDLHPQQKLRGLSKSLLKGLEHCLVDIVNEVGVDINMAISHDHLAGQLAFVSGLGLRKSEALRTNIRNAVQFLENRKDLLGYKLLGNVVYTNCAGFLRIRSENFDDDDDVYDSFNDKGYTASRDSSRRLNPLDNTRIHPECYVTYDFAPKMCGDALEEHLDDPNDYTDTIKKLMNTVRKRLESKLKSSEKWVSLWSNGIHPHGEYYTEIITRNGDSVRKQMSVELPDCLHMLEIGDYCDDLEKQGKGKRRLQIENIKDELRYPWLDLRKPISPPNPLEMFKIITGESDSSLYIGLKVGCTVTELFDETVGGEWNEQYKRIQKAVVQTDRGLRGQISVYEMTDDNIDTERFNMKDSLHVGMTLVAVVIGVQKERVQLELSLKPSLLAGNEAWWLSKRRDNRFKKWWNQTNRNVDELFDKYFLEDDAIQAFNQLEILSAKNLSISDNKDSSVPLASVAPTSTSAAVTKSLKGRQLRHVHHPLFANCTYKEAEERLKSEGKGAGEVVFRPSSKGPDSLAITWAFQTNWFMHIEIEEKGKNPGDLGLGKELYIKEADMKEWYSDLDEIYSRYIEPLNDFVKMMVNFKSFRQGTPEEVDALLHQQRTDQPSRIPYFIRLEPGKPGFFSLVWMKASSASSSSSSQPIKKVVIAARPHGFVMDRETFRNPNDVINSFKRAVMDSTAAANKPKPVAAAVSLSVSAITAGAASNAKRTKFETSKPVLSPAPMLTAMPMPIQSGHGHREPGGGGYYPPPRSSGQMPMPMQMTNRTALPPPINMHPQQHHHHQQQPYQQQQQSSHHPSQYPQQQHQQQQQPYYPQQQQHPHHQQQQQQSYQYQHQQQPQQRQQQQHPHPQQYHDQHQQQQQQHYPQQQHSQYPNPHPHAYPHPQQQHPHAQHHSQQQQHAHQGQGQGIPHPHANANQNARYSSMPQGNNNNNRRGGGGGGGY